MSTRTPWGPSQTSDKIAPGIMNYTTAGHGGVHVSKKRLAAMPEYLRREKGWYEEDCEWTLVALAFPQFFQDCLEGAIDTAKNYYPTIYEMYTGLVLQPGESRKKDEIAFYQAHKDDYLVLSASGDWHEKVPKGMVGVIACIGGRQENSRLPLSAKHFLVPEEEYQQRNRIAFAIDPTRHKEWVDHT